MSQLISRIWKPVQRRGAERYLQLTVLSFAASVSITRLILELTGYPQLGTETLHIAHVLFGGVILYVSSLLPILFSNRWTYTWTAILSGLGVGLFVDEVGKFITETNDYFFPAAAPIIYAFFLLTVLVYQRIKKEPELSVRGSLYAVIEVLQEVLDHSLEPEELDEMKNKLDYIIEEAQNPHFISLAKELQDFVNSDALQTVQEDPNIFDKIINSWNWFEDKYFSEKRVQGVISISLIILGLRSFHQLITFLPIAFNPEMLEVYLQSLASGLPHITDNGTCWILVFILGDGLIGLILTLSGGLIVIGKKNWGAELASISLVIKLVAINLLLFYIRQFYTIIIAAYQFVILQGLYYYERKYVKKSSR
jgi:hypothetical protein